MNTVKSEPWFFRRVLPERQILIFLIAFGLVASLQSFAFYLTEPDFNFCDDKGSFASYLQLFGYRLKLVSFRESFFWYWLCLHALAIFAALKLWSRIGLLLAIVLPTLWVFTIVGKFAPGEGC